MKIKALKQYLDEFYSQQFLMCVLLWLTHVRLDTSVTGQLLAISTHVKVDFVPLFLMPGYSVHHHHLTC